MLVRSLLLLVALFGLLMGDVAAAPGEQKILTHLSNGLKVLVVKDSRFPLVATRLYVRTGSANEDASQAGISHLLEHMVFKGTESRPKGEAARQVESLGGYLNAATSFDKTWYITDMPAAHWRTGMDIVKDMAFHPALDPEELESEKQVVLSELERNQDSPTNRLFESLQTSTLQNTVYKRPIIGFREQIRAITADDLRAYVQRWYQPQNMFLLVAGDIDPAAVLAHAEKLFGSLSNHGSLPAPQPVDLQNAPAGARVEVIRGPWSKIYLGLAFPSPPLRDLRSVHADVLCYLFGGSDTSFLYKNYKYEKQLADSISMGNMSLDRAGMIYLTAQTDAARLQKFWEGLTCDLARIGSIDFSAEDLQRAHLNLEDSIERSAETLNGLAAWLGQVHFALDGEVAADNLRLAQRSTDLADVRKAAELWLVPERMRVRVLAPADASLPDLEAILQKNWPLPASAGKEQAISQKSGQQETVDLGQGRVVELLPDATVPYVAMQLKMPGGNALLTAADQGLANLAARSLLAGSGELDAQGIQRFFGDRAASVAARAGLQTFTLSLTGPARFSDDYFAVLADILTRPHFAEKELRREAEDMKAAIRRRVDRPWSYLSAHLDAFLFPGGQPYGYDPLGSEENLNRFQAGDVRSFWKQQSGQPWVLSVAGDFDREAVLAFARSLPLPRTAGKKVAAPEWGKEKKLDLRLPGRKQAHLLHVYRAVPPTHPDAPALMLLESVLSGQSGPLFSRLRDEEGLGYTVTAFYRSMPEAGLMAFYIGTTPDQIEQGRQGFLQIISDVQSLSLPETLLQAAANRLWGSYYRSRQSLATRAGEAATNTVLGRSRDFDKELIDRACQVTAAQLQEVARKYLQAEHARDILLLP